MTIDKEKFKEILKLTQSELKIYLKDFLKDNGYSDIIDEDGFLYAIGTDNYLLSAHMDRHPNLKERVLTIDEVVPDNGKIRWTSHEGIAGDDRCGVYIICELIKKYKPYVLFFEDEEIGCIGAKKFVNTKYIEDIKTLNYLVEIDRGHGHRNIENKHNKHGRDVVFYNITNKEFIDDVCTASGYKIGAGVGTDVVHLSEATSIASFNISSGYCDEHHLNEFIMLDEVINSYNAVENVINNLHKQYKMS